ncbi:rCG57886 [Rattus norvegicus]|uniref:RCG57886 n=1 Tax=Rattus norvegicus TaxID=10116 RepID=A6J4Z1_RAT|nr:rCG57886 [Rattus norvegicus]
MSRSEGDLSTEGKSSVRTTKVTSMAGSHGRESLRLQMGGNESFKLKPDLQEDELRLPAAVLVPAPVKG